MSNTVPYGWSIGNLTDFSDVNPRLVQRSAMNADTPVSFIKMEDVSNNAVVRNIRTASYGQVSKGFTSFQNGDVLVAKITPCFENGKGGFVQGLRNGVGFGSTEFHVLRARKNSSPKFLYQLTNSEDFRLKGAVNMTGSAGQRRVPTEYLKTLEIAFPPLPEQKKIAAILSSVDEVIEKTRAQIDKLKNLKTGMMQELLTKGIGPGGVPHTEFKDSPVGHIPSEWNLSSLEELSSFITSGSRGWAQYYSASGAIFIRIGNLTRGHINLRFVDTVYVNPPDSAEGKRTKVQSGDVLISITADLGVIGVVNKSMGEAYVNQHISLVRLIEPELARWVGHFLAFENTQKQFIANNDAGAKAGLNLTAIRKTLVALPPTDERVLIVDSLDSIDQAISMKRVKLLEIQDLKKALMQDLLTGKVRVKVDTRELAEA
ncbi:restriction endonuclease subunit S [Vreelandella sp. F11]|uniref:restriction endonuclease subunit S n=1 Tax=Vreelandella sp. F11 TaxID=3394751 RepID=UPI0036D84CFF